MKEIPFQSAVGGRSEPARTAVPCPPAPTCERDDPETQSLPQPARRVRRGSWLFTRGDRYKNLSFIRSGFFKTVLFTAQGREQVTGFHMAGDVIGFDGLASGAHPSGAMALEDSEVCVCSFDQLLQGSESSMQQKLQLQCAMSEEIARDHRVLLILGAMHADQRLAAFLVDLMQRLHLRGWSGSEAVLRMSRQDIGHYLGLTLETVSRAFSHLTNEGILAVRQRHIKVLDMPGLERKATGAEEAT